MQITSKPTNTASIKHIINILALACVLSVVSLSSLADVSTCLAIKDDAKRLACFDNFYKTNKDIEPALTQQQLAPTTPSAPAAVAKVKAPVQTDKPLPLSSPVTITSSVGVTQAQPTVMVDKPIQVIQQPVETAKVVDLVDEFGASALRKNQPARGLQKINATLSKITKGPRKERVFYLDNGQVWKEMESSSLRFKTGQAVYVEKGAITSFHMGKESTKRRTRVKRVK